MGRSPRSRAMALLGVTGAGLVLGHSLAYAIGAPHPSARAELLRETGHWYLPYATQVALLAAAIGLIGLFVSRFTRREAPRSFMRDFAALAATQSGAFVAMEVGERLLSGATLHDLTHGPLLAVGLGVQLVLAVAGALTLRLTELVAELAHEHAALTAPALAAGITTIAATTTVIRPRPGMGATASRAPPILP